MLKKFFISFVAVVILMVAIVLASSYVGNAHTKKFHFANCPAAQKIKSTNRVEFSSRDEAISGGYVPCKKCNP